ncbi:hypothetical protein F4808DRAFT_469492 [Astrocystis sublimbata]|nr:hypothetical protein F4808DRAFT_469492 [Astrocystis sublimbata]
MASLSHLDAPGAYPETPQNEEPTFQTQQHISQDQREPQDLSNVGQNASSSGQDFAASGLHAKEPALAYRTGMSQETPRTLASDTQSQAPLRHAGTSVNDSTFNRETSKPGVMTGAYSRVGNNAADTSAPSNYTYGDIASQSPYDDVKPANTGSTRDAGFASGLASDSPAETTAVNTIGQTSGSSQTNNHNKIQSGLRGSAKTANEEPYWGDIPFGAGVYNGVTGHGSGESAAHQNNQGHQQHTPEKSGTYGGVIGQGSREPATQQALGSTYDASTHLGVHNGVIGHGSDESTARAHQSALQDQNNAFSNSSLNTGIPGQSIERPTSNTSSRYDEPATSGDISHEQRAFPLATVGNTARSAINTNDADQSDRRNSHFKEEFAGAGATAAGVGAARHHYNNEDRRSKFEEDKLPSITTSDRNYQSPPVPSSILERQLNAADEPANYQKDEHSNLGKFGAGAAAAGAGAYGAHKYANRDSTQEQPSGPRDGQHASYEPMTSASSHNREPTSSSAYLHNEHEAQQPAKHHDFGKRDAATAGAAGAGAYGASQYANRDTTAQQSYPESKSGLTSTVSQPAHAEKETKEHKKHHFFGRHDATKDDTATQPPTEDAKKHHFGTRDATAAGAVGAGAYGASQYANRDKDAQSSSIPQSSVSQDTTREPASSVAHPSNSDNRYPQNTEKYIAGAAATGAGAYGADKLAHRDNTQSSSLPESSVPQSTTRESIRGDPQTLDSNVDNGFAQKDDRSSIGKYGAAAAAAAGAGAYGANKYANRDQTQEPGITSQDTGRSNAQYNTLNDGTPSGIATTGANQPDSSIHNHADPLYNTLRDGTPSGIATSTVHQPESNSRSAVSQSDRYQTPSQNRNSIGAKSAAGRSSTDSSHGGKYNVLSSGTPSGVNLDQVRHHSPPRVHAEAHQQPSSTHTFDNTTQHPASMTQEQRF